MSIDRSRGALASLFAKLSDGVNPKRELSLNELSEGQTYCYLNAINLLDDARLLARNDRLSRALSLAILALEELAKVPALDKAYIESRTSSDGRAWKELWKTFSSHKPKQQAISQYGELLRALHNLQNVSLINPTPYGTYLPPDSDRYLDAIKQRGFYSDYYGKGFHLPQNTNDIKTALDHLFAFAEERADSFGSWHISPQRSKDFLAARPSLLLGNELERAQETWTPHNWTVSYTPIEVKADLLRLLSYRSSGSLSDYFTFYPQFYVLLERFERAQQISILQHLVLVLRQRIELTALARSQERAWNMFKLLFGFSDQYFGPSEREIIYKDLEDLRADPPSTKLK